VTDREPIDYDLWQVIAAIRRFWWLTALVPLLVAGALIVRNLTADFQTSFQVTVLLPGDTEIPGSAERPELMILDDIGPVVRSQAFAELVATAASLPLDDIEGSLSISRYSRVVTVTAYAGDADEARWIAEAANTVLPNAVNTYMVADGGTPATIRTIEPPGEPIRGEANKWTVTALATLVALAIGIFGSLVMDAMLRVRRDAETP
jgi:capsular polysaccharide biosynthesis protein